ncbi:MAG: hypothetical protein GEU94_18395 [Micromonosporaceae bacterium]|nr:hypothetical protein [Micromonosporaceae bacterium]
MVAVVRPFALSVPPENEEDDGPRVAWLGLEIDGEDAFLFRREGDGKPAFMSAHSAQQACRLMSRIAPATRIVWLTSEPLDVERDDPEFVGVQAHD